MQHRRGKKFDHYGVFEPANELDQWGRGVQVPASYYMLIESEESRAHQREVQKKLEQPLLFFYSHDFRLNSQDRSLAQTATNAQVYNASRNGPNYYYGAQDELYLMAFTIK